MYKGDLYLARRICKTIGHIYGDVSVEKLWCNGHIYTREKSSCIHCQERYKFSELKLSRCLPNKKPPPSRSTQRGLGGDSGK
jgi:hypothetical protein